MAMRNLIAFTGFAAMTPELGAPAPDRVVDGTTAFRTFNLDEGEDGRLFAGRWEASVGAWRVRYDEWEYCHIVRGAGRLTGDDGETLTLRPGVSFIVQPGFTGVFTVTEDLAKDYVILLPG